MVRRKRIRLSPEERQIVIDEARKALREGTSFKTLAHSLKMPVTSIYSLTRELRSQPAESQPVDDTEGGDYIVEHQNGEGPVRTTWQDRDDALAEYASLASKGQANVRLMRVLPVQLVVTARVGK